MNDIYRSKGSVTIEIEDDDTGEEHTFEMDNIVAGQSRPKLTRQ